MNVLILGYKGLVGSSLIDPLMSRGSFVGGLDLHNGGDVTNLEGLRESVAAIQRGHSGLTIDWIVNLAAMTAVDACETDEERANACNGTGARNAAIVAKEMGARLLHVSTDYVFDGTQTRPYSEADEPNPKSAYGRSKLLGERGVKEVSDPERLLIVRGQSLYGYAHKSFPDAIAAMAQGTKPVKVVVDQIVSPTWAPEFARGLVDLMTKGASGVFHLSSSGHCSWFEFAKFVFEEWNIDPTRLEKTTVASLGRAAKRPDSSVFDLSKFTSVAGHPPRSWKEQFVDYSTTKAVYR